MGLLLNNRAFILATPLEREAKRYITDCFPVPLAGVDVIIGYRADDSYFSYARDFISGVISYEQLGKAMQLGSLGEQYCLKTEKAFQHLKFIAKEHVPSAEWYSKRCCGIGMPETDIRTWKRKPITGGNCIFPESLTRR